MVQSRARSPILLGASPPEPLSLQPQMAVAAVDLVQSELLLRASQEIPLALLPSSSSLLDDFVMPEYSSPISEDFK